LANALPIGEKMSYVAIKIGAWLITGLAAFVLLWDASGAAQKPPPIVGQITTNLNSTPPNHCVNTVTYHNHYHSA
jgi:hypothetical protein